MCVCVCVCACVPVHVLCVSECLNVNMFDSCTKTQSLQTAKPPTKTEEVGRQTLLAEVVVGTVQHLQLRAGAKAAGQLVQLVHSGSRHNTLFSVHFLFSTRTHTYTHKHIHTYTRIQYTYTQTNVSFLIQTLKQA